MSKYLNLVSWFGGKFPHLPWLLSQFPTGDLHFIDLMCGSANVSLNVNYPLVTINDLNSDVVNLFKVLRDHEEELTRRIYFTPFSRDELNTIIDSSPTSDPIERARRYFVKCQIGYAANGSQNNHRGIGFEYAPGHRQYYKVDGWNLKLRKLASIADKLRGFQIENRDAFSLLERADIKNNFIYVDPPYLFHTRSSKKRYRHEVDIDFHEKMAKKLLAIKNAYWCISGYNHEIYNDFFKDFNVSRGPVSKANTAKKERREVIWFNYELSGKTLNLFE